MMRVLVACCLGACSFVHGSQGSGGPGSEGVDAPTVDPNQDSDGDGIPDIADNCPFVKNPDQHNHDGDDRGDACDVCPHIIDSGEDSDQDGVGDACDPHPSVPGDKIVLFEGFYDKIDWTPVVGGSAWQSGSGVLTQTDTSAIYQLMKLDTTWNNVFVDVGLHVAKEAANSSRHSTGIVLGYRATDDYLFCGVASQGGAVELDAGDNSPDTSGFNWNSNPIDAPMTGEAITLQARTTQGSGDGYTHIDCAGQDGTVITDATYDPYTQAAGNIGVRTNGVGATFDYVFVVEVPPGT
jgi:hypothetical protein